MVAAHVDFTIPQSRVPNLRSLSKIVGATYMVARPQMGHIPATEYSESILCGGAGHHIGGPYIHSHLMDIYPQRKRLRLHNADYSAARCYFLTICTHNRTHRFCQIENGQVLLWPSGEMLRDHLLRLKQQYPHAILDEWGIMPNHIHLILELSSETNTGIPQIIGWLKTITTNGYARGVRNHAWPPFDTHLWQRSYHDRIIRNREEHERIAQYIFDNPKTWKEDRFYVL